MLYGFYGGLLPEKQNLFLKAYYEDDCSLSEIAEQYGISRQGVFDNLSRAEALLKNMEAKTGCVRRDRACRKAIEDIRTAVDKLSKHNDSAVVALAQQIVDAVDAVEE